MQLETSYTTAYFESHVEGSLRSARQTLPLVFELTDVKSAVDVGCGIGAWLSALIELGVDDVVGVDGAYVDANQLLFPQELFVPHDLVQHLDLGRTFDLSMSLEVAEHLPPDRAEGLVATLVDLAPLVLFSAAIPGQGGIGHINERWPDYWAGLFAKHDYVPVDALRYRIWDTPDIEPWYAQNALLFASPPVLDASPNLKRELDRAERPLNVVHPRIFEIWRPNSLPPSVRDLLQPLPRAVIRSVGLEGTRTRLARRLRSGTRRWISGLPLTAPDCPHSFAGRTL